jgi:hypothetical protein
MKKYWLIFLSIAILSPAWAADFGAYQLNLPSKDIVSGPQLYINHRFLGPVSDLYNTLGEDLGANMSVGFGLPLNQQLEAALFRSVMDKTYLLSGKCKIGDQATLFLAAAAKTASGITANKTSGIIGGIFTFPLRNIDLGVVPAIAASDSTAYTIGLITNIPFNQKLGTIIEYTPVLGSQTGRFPVISAGIKYHIAVHYFTLMLTNSTYSSFDEVIRGSTDNMVHLGFNIVVMF